MHLPNPSEILYANFYVMSIMNEVGLVAQSP